MKVMSIAIANYFYSIKLWIWRMGPRAFSIAKSCSYSSYPSYKSVEMCFSTDDGLARGDWDQRCATTFIPLLNAIFATASRAED